MTEAYVLITFYEDIIQDVDVYLNKEIAEERYYKLIRELLLEQSKDTKELIFKSYLYTDIDALIRSAPRYDLNEFYGWYVDIAGCDIEDAYQLYYIELIEGDQ
jgi:hypothetical protein